VSRPGSPDSNITELLHALRSADAGAAGRIQDCLYAAVYDELKQVAAALMKSERAGHTLEPSAVVHEAYCKLVGTSNIDWQNRVHFLGTATRAMRQVLVDYARRRRAGKRGGGWERVTLTNLNASGSDLALEIIDLDRALSRLATLSERMAQVVELRVFGGMTHREIAEILSVSTRTTAEDWAVARRWLARELAGAGPRQC
jgi:RNA polymerase sigma factor (TIGR02999 family)